MPMYDPSGSIVRCCCREQWREWLSEHFQSRREAWLVFPNKDSGEEGVSYNDAVEEALCFGWIDSTARRLDDMHQLRRFTPRRKGSPFSRPNVERLIWLDKRGLIHPGIRESVAEILREPYVFPEDLLAILREDEVVWKNYSGFPEPYRRIRIAYIDDARRLPEEFRRRLEHFIARTRQNKLIIGYGGVDKYYKTDLL